MRIVIQGYKYCCVAVKAVGVFTMTVQIDASEVLYHLNSYGIQCIEEGAFEQFIQGKLPNVHAN